ncbi:MAG: pyridoxamine 5'-phosphate oxidase family protein [Pseudomonadota bacterium]
MSDTAPSLIGFLDLAWRIIEAGVADPKAPARQVVFATCGRGGAPGARILILRAADRAAGTVEVHTDLASAKVTELERDPRAALLFWDAGAQVQIRLTAACTVLRGPAVADRWTRVPERSRRGYGVEPPPGTPIADPYAVTRPGAQARFAAIEARVEALEALQLGQDGHVRAAYKRSDDWRGHWLAP